MMKENFSRFPVLLCVLAAGLLAFMATQSCFAAEIEAPAEKEMSAECRAFASDPDADLGEVLKAGCEPTLAQMSALMDNPLGNVAMLFTQFDYYKMKNDENGEEASKAVYMGIAQFPKKLNKDW